MTNQELTNRLNNITKGAFVRIKYKTDLPLQAAYKKNGFTIQKIVEQTIRVGVSYNKISRVQAKLASRVETPNRTYKNPYKQVIKNMIYEHESTGMQYLQFATVPNNAHVKTTYTVTNAAGEVRTGYTKQDIINLNMVTASYWNDHDVPEVQKVKIENIISL